MQLNSIFNFTVRPAHVNTGLYRAEWSNIIQIPELHPSGHNFMHTKSPSPDNIK